MRCARLTWLQSCLTWLSVCVCKHFAKVPGALRNPAANTQEHQGRGMYQRLNYSSIEKHSWPHLNMADLYAYVTFTTPSRLNIPEDMARFVDRLQELDAHLPLRMVPLEIREFTPVKSRQNELTYAALM